MRNGCLKMECVFLDAGVARWKDETVAVNGCYGFLGLGLLAAAML